MDIHMKVFIVFWVTVLFCNVIKAQKQLRIYHKDGCNYGIPITEIDSITFTDGDSILTDERKMAGSWLWDNTEVGYYELLTFNTDNTYTAYDNYFMYGFDIKTYGWYWQYGSILKLSSEGYGYNNQYTWFVVAMTTNALDVMTKMGKFTYYRINKKPINIKIGDSLECQFDEKFVFADNVIVCIIDDKIFGIKEGITYIQKMDHTGEIVAYKIIVEK